MKLTNKNILIISPEPWDHIFISKHHYAIHLGRRGNKVYFLNPPSTSNEIVKTDYKNVHQVNYKGFPRGLRFFPSFLQKRMINKVFKEVENLINIKFDIVWSFDNSVFYNFSALPADTIKISHIVDLNQNFQTKIAAETANICFGVCTPIVKRLAAYNKNTYFINHGCYPSLPGKEVSLPGSNSIKAFYAGNLNIGYIDWRLFKEVIVENKNVDFILAGPWFQGSLREDILSFSNVYYMGLLKSEELKDFYATANVLLLLYRADEYSDQLSNSHKMMEYLASGKMIVATFTSEYELLEKEGLIAMSKKNDDFLQIFNDTLANLAMWNAEEKQLARKAFALENTYDKQINRIEELIKDENKES